MRLFGLKNCDTCRKALKALPNAQFFDVRADGIPTETLVLAFKQFDEKLLNMRSTTWRSLTESERAQPPLELLAAHPTLMKRPLIEVNGTLYLGWTEATRAALGVV